MSRRSTPTRGGQSVLEYALCLAIATMALVGSQHYLRRAMEGRLKQGGEILGEKSYVPRRTTAQDVLTITQRQVNTQREIQATDPNGQQVGLVVFVSSVLQDDTKQEVKSQSVSESGRLFGN